MTGYSNSNATLLCPSPLILLDFNDTLNLPPHSVTLWVEPSNNNDNSSSYCAQPCPTIAFEKSDFASIVILLIIVASISTAITSILLWSQCREYKRFFLRIMFILGFFGNSCVICVFIGINNTANNVVCASNGASFITKSGLCLFQAAVTIFTFMWINTWSVILCADTYIRISITNSTLFVEKLKSKYLMIGVLIPTIFTIIPLAGNNLGYDPHANMPICFFMFSDNMYYFWVGFMLPFYLFLLISLGLTIACIYRVHEVLIMAPEYYNTIGRANKSSHYKSWVERFTSEFGSESGIDGLEIMSGPMSAHDLFESNDPSLAIRPSEFMADPLPGNNSMSLRQQQMDRAYPLMVAALSRMNILPLSSDASLIERPSSSNFGIVMHTVSAEFNKSNTALSAAGHRSNNPIRTLNRDNQNEQLFSITNPVNRGVMPQEASMSSLQDSTDDSLSINSSPVLNKIPYVPRVNHAAERELTPEDILAGGSASDLDSSTRISESFSTENSGQSSKLARSQAMQSDRPRSSTANTSEYSSDGDWLMSRFSWLCLGCCSTLIKFSSRETSQTSPSSRTVKSILSAIWRYNGRSVIFIVVYGLTNLSVLPLLLVLYLIDFEKNENSAAGYASCLVRAAEDCPVQTQVAINNCSQEACGALPNPHPNHVMLCFIFFVVAGYGVVPPVIFNLLGDLSKIASYYLCCFSTGRLHTTNNRPMSAQELRSQMHRTISGIPGAPEFSNDDEDVIA